jgi:hypothetical protein
VARSNQFLHDGRTDKTCGSSDENTHVGFLLYQSNRIVVGLRV